METKAEILKAINTLNDYCDSNVHCSECVFDGARTELGLTCRVAELLEEEKYRDVLKGE